MDIDYVKFTDYRDPAFRIRTMIYEKGDMKYVRKLPKDDMAKAHVEKMLNSYILLSKVYKHIKFCSCTKVEGAIEFSFIEGLSFEEKLLSNISEKNLSSFKELIIEYINILKDSRNIELSKFEVSEGFIDIFGQVIISKEHMCLPISNIDMGFDNIIINSDNTYIIDYEWVYDFLIPIDFIIYRNLRNFYNRYSNLLNHNKFPKFKETIYGLDIKDADIILYETMEKNFLLKTNGLINNLVNYSKNYFHVSKLEELMRRSSYEASLQLFWSYNSDFNELDSIKKKINLSNDKEITFKLIEDNIGSNLRKIRIDPHIDSCIIKVKRITLKGIDKSKDIDLSKLETNGIKSNDGYYYFLNEDPQIIIDLKSVKYKVSEVIFEMEDIITDIGSKVAIKKISELYNSKFHNFRKQLFEKERIIDEFKKVTAYGKLKRKLIKIKKNLIG